MIYICNDKITYIGIGYPLCSCFWEKIYIQHNDTFNIGRKKSKRKYKKSTRVIL